MIDLLATDLEPRRLPSARSWYVKGSRTADIDALVMRHAMAAARVFGAVCSARPLRERGARRPDGRTLSLPRDGLPHAAGAGRAASLGLREDYLGLRNPAAVEMGAAVFFGPTDPHAAAAQLRPPTAMTAPDEGPCFKAYT